MSAGSAGTLAAVATTPIDVVKTRIMLAAAGDSGEGQREKVINEMQAQGKDAKAEIEKAQRAARGGKAGGLAVAVKRPVSASAEMSVSTKQSPSTGIVSQPKGPLLRELFDGLITIKLETCNSTFYIHKGLLCHHSPVFTAMLEHDWKEKQEGFVTLNSEEHNVFRRFVLWLYYGKILDYDESLITIPAQELLDCYFLADRRDIPAMQNFLINTIISKAQAVQATFCDYQRYVWCNTPGSSPLRRLLVDMMALRGNIPLFMEAEDEKNRFDKSYIVDVLIRKYKNPNPITWDQFFNMRCDYHFHNERVPVCSS
ncbi:MAG: hypothetical protein Q9192_007780 [Flavoplaca navasiana]